MSVAPPVMPAPQGPLATTGTSQHLSKPSSNTEGMRPGRIHSFHIWVEYGSEFQELPRPFSQEGAEPGWEHRWDTNKGDTLVTPTSKGASFVVLLEVELITLSPEPQHPACAHPAMVPASSPPNTDYPTVTIDHPEPSPHSVSPGRCHCIIVVTPRVKKGGYIPDSGQKPGLLLPLIPLLHPAQQ